MPTSTPALSLFETDNYLAINAARWGLASRVISELKAAGLPLSTAFDLGAGPGWFANEMSRSGLDVIALEAREDVAALARLSAPLAKVELFDLDAVSLNDLPISRDFVLAFGILYHLENPLRALRIARAMCGGVLLLETMTLPDALPKARVIRENANPTQGLRELALLLSPTAVEWGLWAAGFQKIYRFAGALDHPDFVDKVDSHRRRHIWLASDRTLNVPEFEPVCLEEPQRGNFWGREQASM